MILDNYVALQSHRRPDRFWRKPSLVIWLAWWHHLTLLGPGEIVPLREITISSDDEEFLLAILANAKREEMIWRRHSQLAVAPQAKESP